MPREDPPVTSRPADIKISADDPRAPITLDIDDNELPLSLDLPLWLVLDATGPALKLAHLIVLLHRQPPTDRPVTRELLAALLGKSVDRVDAYTKELAKVGWLTVTRRRSNGWQVPNEYRYRHSPPPGHITARTVGDLMALADARQTAPVDNSKPAGQSVAAEVRPRSRKNAATATTSPETRRSERSRRSAATQPQKRGPYKELTYSSSYSIDRATDELPREQQKQTPSDAARDLVRRLDYGRHLPPAISDLDQVASLVDAAAELGLTFAEIRVHCQAAIGRCRSAVVPYLVGALGSDRLPTPRHPQQAVPHGAEPVCGRCDARPGDPVSARVIWLDNARTRSARCPRCHPGRAD